MRRAAYRARVHPRLPGSGRATGPPGRPWPTRPRTSAPSTHARTGRRPASPSGGCRAGARCPLARRHRRRVIARGRDDEPARVWCTAGTGDTPSPPSVGASLTSVGSSTVAPDHDSEQGRIAVPLLLSARHPPTGATAVRGTSSLARCRSTAIARPAPPHGIEVQTQLAAGIPNSSDTASQ